VVGNTIGKARGHIVRESMLPTTRDVSGPLPRLDILDADMARVLSAKTGAERLAIAAGMFRSARRMLSSHLRSERPDWSAQRVQDEVAGRLSHGTR
jgi:hypothetical protein